MTTLFDSTRPVKSARRFAAGLSTERRKPYTATDLKWAAQELSRNARDYDVVSPGPEPDWDAMAAERWAEDCLTRGLEWFDPYLIP
jgi:hypothetical protein